MLTVYLSSFIFGIILILASLVLGEKEADLDSDADVDLSLDMDADADVDLDLDLDADADVDLDLDADISGDGDFSKDFDKDIAGGALPFFSVRFWTFFLAAFGLTGALLVWQDIPTLINLPIALVTGGSIGTLIWWVFQKLKEGSVETTSLATMQGQEAEVLLSIQPGGTGKIRLFVEDRHIDLLAITRDGRALQRGEQVLIVSMDGPTACVTPMGRLKEEKDARAEEADKKKLAAQNATRTRDL